MEDLHRLLWRYLLPYRFLVLLLRKLPFPGQPKLNMAKVLGFFLVELVNGALTTRASAIAFNFFLALFPALIFLFTLIPFFPIQGLQDEIFSFFAGILPDNAFGLISNTLSDIIANKRGSLLSFGFVTTIYFATNGLASLIDAFNPQDERHYLKRRLLALGLLVVLSVLVIIGVAASIAGELLVHFLYERASILDSAELLLLNTSKWLIILLVTFVAVAAIYHYGSPPGRRLYFWSPGSWLATLSIALISYAYGYYVDNFGQYNRLYGSLGTIIITMLWMYFIALVLLIWYIFNGSIKRLSEGKGLRLDPFSGS